MSVEVTGEPSRRRFLGTAAALAAVSGIPGPARAAGPSRCALVVGNAAYPSSPLRNAVHDARSMAKELARLGFEVIELHDATKARMEHGLAELGARLAGRQGVGLFFYAGHGIQLDWRNYLLAVDAAPHSADEVPAHSLDVQQTVDALRAAGTRINVIVLDACRDNPFGAGAGTRGLAPMDAPPGTYFAYATAPGNVADDGGEQGNGLFTHYLLKEIGQVGAPIEAVFKRVRMHVRQASRGRQIPWDSSSLVDDFVFATGERLPAPQRSDFEVAYAVERAEWDRIAASTKPEDLYTFLRRHPTGLFAEIAQARLERLERARIVAQAERDQPAQDPAVVRYKVGDTYELVQKDGLTGLVLQSLRSVVTRVGDDLVEYEITPASGRPVPFQVTPFGAMVREAQATYNPPLVVIPVGQLQVGRRWRGRTRRSIGSVSDWVDYDARIVARESVTVPAGRFDTYRIEMRQMFGDGLYRVVTRWVDAARAISMKVVSESRRAGGTADILVSETVSFSRGP